MINTDGFFKGIFKNARENSVIILDNKGVILQVNQSFITAFGYKTRDIVGKHLRILFTKEDRKLKRPEAEVTSALELGSKSDNNYLVQKDGVHVWVMGETVSVTNSTNEEFLVKIIHNIHAQKQLERFLLQSHEFIDIIFDSIKDTGLIILDSSLRIVKSNRAFNKIFGLKKIPRPGDKLSDIDHPFWRNRSIKTELLNILVNRRLVKNTPYTIPGKGGETHISITSKLMEGEEKEKQVLLVITVDQNG
ncbi:MAG TPA: PAS domain-containing protein [Ferruginibacter sp.]|nr:PAS domain-containing protein [Ferruginibacter sp.]